MSRSPLRVAIVGYGLAGRVFHAPLVAAEPDMRITAIVTSDPERRAAAQNDHPGARVVETADRLWESPADVDLVVIGAPNRAHVPLARAAIAAGIAVVVDKPFTPTAASGRALVEEAEAAGVMLTVFQNRRWDGDFLTVRRLVREGAVGPVVRFESRFDRWRPEVADRWRERAGVEEAGGVLADLGSHLIDQALVLFGPPVSVHAEIDMRRPGAVVDDDMLVSLVHADGVRSHLGASMVEASPGPRMRLLGLAATYEVDGLDGQEAALGDGARPGEGEWGRTPPEAWGRLVDGASTRPVETEPGDYPAFYAGVARSLRDGVPPPVDPRDSVTGLEIIEAARAAAGFRLSRVQARSSG